MTQAAGELLYESNAGIKSLWNRYKIYADRIELDFRCFFTRIVIRRSEFAGIEASGSLFKISSLWALKLDLADLYPHLCIVRNRGVFKRIRFTPADPEEFRQKVLEWAAPPGGIGM